MDMCDLKADHRSLEILSYFAKITSISDLEQLIDTVVEKTPALLGAKGCSIYLLPKLVQGHDGRLMDRGGRSIAASTIDTEYIVLAKTSRPDSENLVGKAFYPKGQGLSGWVFKHGQPLRLEDMRDQKKLGVIASDLSWTDRYGGSQDYYGEQAEKMPILVVPLIVEQQTIGILKIPAKENKCPFTEADEQIITVIAQIIANLIEKSRIVKQQTLHISQLVEISAEENWEVVAGSVTESLAGILNSECQLYLRNQESSFVELAFKNGKPVINDEKVTFQRGEGFIGWIFRTGKPLMIRDARQYVKPRYLEDDVLNEISDGPYINEEDRELSCKYVDLYCAAAHPVLFLGVPVRASDGSIYGVLCASHINGGGSRRVDEFDRTELQLAQSFASTISVAKENDRDRQLGDLLIHLGRLWDVDELFNLVAQETPKLISGSGCSIYKYQRNNGESVLKLADSTCNDLTRSNGRPIQLIYHLGEGKTGFCGLSKATLIVNHYGRGLLAHQAIDDEMKRIVVRHPEDYVEYLRDRKNREIGVVQLRRGRESPVSQQQFRDFARDLPIGEDGLDSSRMNALGIKRKRLSWSFVAVPILYDTAKMYGLITMGRSVRRDPFSKEDITLIESITHQLANVMFSFEMLNERKHLMMTLAHEINTPLVGILADSENLISESSQGSEIEDLSVHLIGQVKRLHLLTETIMAVISGETASREFSLHSIYRPLMSAIELFESEARELGFDIRGPWHRGRGDPFPAIEMSLFDLQIAFQNVVHNAVKYSFRSSAKTDESRFIRVLGRWLDDEHYSVSIDNYGVGITQEEIERRLIFKPYYRGEYASDRRRTGAGFGLAHARQIIEDLHHGEIRVESKPLPGYSNPHLTTFTVILPIKQP